MPTNRLFAVFVVLSLLLVAAFTFRAAVATSAVTSTGYTSYDEVERIRSNFSRSIGADQSYDEVEHIRSAGVAAASGKAVDASYDEVEHIRSARDAARIGPADTSYDEVEHIRSAATTSAAVESVGKKALPFGPQIAATYGSSSNGPIELTHPLPFGPGLAATYGVPSERVTGSAYPLPFGPGLAATYGVPAR